MRHKYVFEKDSRAITLYKVTTVKDKESKNYGNEVNQFIGYYSCVESLIKKLVMLELIEKGDIKDLLLDLKTVNNNIKQLIADHLS